MLLGFDLQEKFVGQKLFTLWHTSIKKNFFINKSFSLSIKKRIEHTKRDFYMTARFPAVAFEATATSKAMATSTMELMLWVMASKI